MTPTADAPKISVCLATLDGMPWLPELMTSVLSQLGPASEVVVSDGGSGDGTLDYLAQLPDGRIRLLPDAGPPGATANFERALAACRGRLIFLCDQDDVWMPGKVEKMTRCLMGASLAVCDCELIDADGKVLAPSFFRRRGTRRGFWRNLWKNGYSGNCMACDRELLERALPFPPGVAMHDWWLGLLAERMDQVVLLPEVLVQWRRHGRNATPEAGRSPMETWRQLVMRARMLRAIFSAPR